MSDNRIAQIPMSEYDNLREIKKHMESEESIFAQHSGWNYHCRGIITKDKMVDGLIQELQTTRHTRDNLETELNEIKQQQQLLTRKTTKKKWYNIF